MTKRRIILIIGVLTAGIFFWRKFDRLSTSFTCHLSGQEEGQAPKVNSIVLVQGMNTPISVAFAPGVKEPFALGKSGALYHSPSNERIYDFGKKIDHVGFATGAMSVAFHPKFQENHKFYFMYHPVIENIRIIEKKMDPKTFKVDDAYEKVILAIDRERHGHSGGQMLFGADGHLYISTGDGSDSSDGENNAQNLTNLEGKILRLDVDHGDPYAIPSDNPNLGPGSKREIYAYGFRNPWRFSIDYQTGDLWVGDVGNATIEEISRVKKGGNYGWRIMEGNLCQEKPKCNKPGMIPPVFTYTHAEGNSIIAGILYRGQAISWLRDHFVYADFGTRRIYALKLDKPDAIERIELLDMGESV